MKNTFLVFIVLITNAFAGNAPTVSVIIPCTSSHLQYIPDLLEAIEQQTSIPDEVVISISKVTENDLNFIEAFKSHPWPFSLLVYSSPKRQFAGDNRNIAIKHSSGEVIVCQDADDFPHPQRIEIIRDVYNTQPFDLLLHFYVRFNNSTNSIEENKLQYDSFDLKKCRFTISNFSNKAYLTIGDMPNNQDFMELNRSNSNKIISGAHNGHISFSRNVFNKVQYSSLPTGQDVAFNKDVLKNFKRCSIINLPLTYYVMERSTLEERSK